MANHAISTPERAVSLVLEAEITSDLDTGRPTLIASTGHHQEDLDAVSPDRLRQMVEEARIRLEQLEQLAADYEPLVRDYDATAMLRAVVAEHHLIIEEWDPSCLEPRLRAEYMGHRVTDEFGGRLIVVPMGQSPTERLQAVVSLVRDMEGEA